MNFEELYKKYMDAVYPPKEKGIVIKRVGLNLKGRERILLFATAGVNLNDYVVCIKQSNGNNYQLYRFPKNKNLERDSYICLFTDSSDCIARMGEKHVLTFHMNEKRNILNINDEVSLLKITEVSKKIV